MFKRKNYEENFLPGIFNKNDANVVLRFIGEMFGQYVTTPRKGTFILEYQGHNTVATTRLMSFEFEGGTKKNFVGSDRNSRLLGESLMSGVSTYSKNTGSAVRYSYNTPYFLSLETDDGRFNAVYFVDSGYYEDQIVMYCMLAKLFSLMAPGDKVLQESWNKTYDEESKNYNGLSRLCEFEEKLFRKVS